MKRELRKNSGIQNLLAKYRKSFHISRNLNYYSAEDESI
jgi:hypothetical protein